MVELITPYAGNLHDVLPRHWAHVILVLCALLCGLIVGIDREYRQKPAGLRTVMLICVGSTIFTLASILMAGERSDPARIAAQIVTGVGFLGAGAIIRDRGTVVGMTTGATIWTVAAIGVVIGAGYALAGLVLTLVVVFIVAVVLRVEVRVDAPCEHATCRLFYRPEGGKTRVRIAHHLDAFDVPDSAWSISEHEGLEVMELRYCRLHKRHRAVLTELVNVEGLVEIRPDRTAGSDQRSSGREGPPAAKSEA
ncbi:MAG: MgtC/SapB family protein [Phycisphaerales bacterium]|nr:MAG: MgtC/SapB family protein [Phycisphaerales bacterium]